MILEATTPAPGLPGRMGEAPAARSRHSGYDRLDLSWHKFPDGWALHCVGRPAAVVLVIPDGTYPAMWRIQHPDGRLSDMANISWARDGAIAAAYRILALE
jgi:hypothetical protein